VQVWGDYFSQKSSEARTVTTFKIFANYENMLLEAFDNTVSYFNSLMQSNSIYTTT
jgi:hypothetical protein